MNRSLLYLLACANFAVGVGAFGVIGLLTPVAGAFTLTPSEAGAMMSLYALVYAVSSPLLIALTGAADRSRVLVGGLILFAAGAAIAALASTFGSVLAARALMAIGGGLITPVTASIGVAVTPAAHRGKALATILGGLTLAQAIGVPFCAWIGYAFGWRVAFAFVAAMTLACCAMLYRMAPRALSVPRTTLATLGRVLASPRLVLAISFTAFFLGGAYAFYTFLAPYAEARYALGRDGVTALLAVFGVGAVVGNMIGGWLTDRIGPVRTLALLGCAQTLALIPMTLLPLPPLGLGALIALWSCACWAFMVPQQARLVALAAPLTPVLFALNAAAIYLGGSIGSIAGGNALRHLGYAALGPAGAILVALALLSLFIVARMARPTEETTDP